MPISNFSSTRAYFNSEYSRRTSLRDLTNPRGFKTEILPAIHANLIALGQIAEKFDDLKFSDRKIVYIKDDKGPIFNVDTPSFQDTAESVKIFSSFILHQLDNYALTKEDLHAIKGELDSALESLSKLNMQIKTHEFDATIESMKEVQQKITRVDSLAEAREHLAKIFKKNNQKAEAFHAAGIFSSMIAMIGIPLGGIFLASGIGIIPGAIIFGIGALMIPIAGVLLLISSLMEKSLLQENTLTSMGDEKFQDFIREKFKGMDPNSELLKFTSFDEIQELMSEYYDYKKHLENPFA